MKIGNKVIVTKPGFLYSGYSDMARLMKSKCWDGNLEVKCGDKGTITNLHLHEREYEGLLALVKIGDKETIIHTNGIKVINKGWLNAHDSKGHFISKAIENYACINGKTYKLVEIK